MFLKADDDIVGRPPACGNTEKGRAPPTVANGSEID